MYLGMCIPRYTCFQGYRYEYHLSNKEKYGLVLFFFSESVRVSPVTDAKCEVVFLYWLNNLSAMEQECGDKLVQVQASRYGLAKRDIFIRQICICRKSFVQNKQSHNCITVLASHLLFAPEGTLSEKKNLRHYNDALYHLI